MGFSLISASKMGSQVLRINFLAFSICLLKCAHKNRGFILGKSRTCLVYKAE